MNTAISAIRNALVVALITLPLWSQGALPLYSPYTILA